MDSGKRFESRFSTSLHRLAGASTHGYATRLEDGGATAKNRQLADFLFFSDDGHTWAIECKATKERSFPLTNLRDNQMDELHRFEYGKEKRHSVLAINFWDEPYRDHNDCYLILFANYCTLYVRAAEMGRASIPREWIEAAGKRQEPMPGGWRLDFGGLIDAKG